MSLWSLASPSVAVNFDNSSAPIRVVSVTVNVRSLLTCEQSRYSTKESF